MFYAEDSEDEEGTKYYEENEYYINDSYTYQQIITITFIEKVLLKYFSKEYLYYLFDSINITIETFFIDLINYTLNEDLMKRHLIIIKNRSNRLYEIHRYLHSKMMYLTRLYVKNPIKSYYYDIILL